MDAADTSNPANAPAEPWDQALAERVQPVISAIFHDLMGPLTVLKNRLYLVRRQMRSLADDASLAADVREKAAAVLALLDVLDEAGHRIHRGITVPRDAVWETVLVGTPFDPAAVIEAIGQATHPHAATPASMGAEDPDGVETASGHPNDAGSTRTRRRAPDEL